MKKQCLSYLYNPVPRTRWRLPGQDPSPRPQPSYGHSIMNMTKSNSQHSYSPASAVCLFASPSAYCTVPLSGLSLCHWRCEEEENQNQTYSLSFFLFSPHSARFDAAIPSLALKSAWTAFNCLQMTVWFCDFFVNTSVKRIRGTTVEISSIKLTETIPQSLFSTPQTHTSSSDKG